MHMRRILALLASVLLVLTGLGLTTASAASAASCSTPWGSTTKSAGPATHGEVVTGLRSGRHACYDRLVFEATGKTGYRLAYEKVYSIKGKPVTVSGGATLHLTLKANGHNPDTGSPVLTPSKVNRTFPGYATFRQLKMASDFEGQVDLALGVRAKLPMHVFQSVASNGKNLVVIDVAHHW
jgi:hypothetical protein